ELLHQVSSEGIDFAAVVDHARNTGLPELQKLTFHQRGVILKKLGAHLMERTKDYHEISYTTGTTKRDAFVDIEGGIGTLFTYSGVARRQMPNSTVHLDGGIERLSKNGTFVGRHILTSRQGLALQINAFNFPVWGMLEKFGPMFVAGLPVVVKPATDTAHLTRAVVDDMVGSGLLPDGAIQLISGDVTPLFDQLAEQDAIAFTGSEIGRASCRERVGSAMDGIRDRNVTGVQRVLFRSGPMFVAGLPVVVKPATDTAHLTRAVVDDMVGSGLLPDGAIQLISGDVTPLFDQLAEQDAIAFTGS